MWLLAYAGMGASQALVQSLFWDVYVAPEHDTPRSLKLKVPLSHTPNVITCLSFLVLHENAWLFVALQTYGLVACCIGQRFPAPWAREPIRAPMVERGKRGWLRATGYIESAPERTASPA